MQRYLLLLVLFVGCTPVSDKPADVSSSYYQGYASGLMSASTHPDITVSAPKSIDPTPAPKPKPKPTGQTATAPVTVEVRPENTSAADCPSGNCSTTAPRKTLRFGRWR